MVDIQAMLDGIGAREARKRAETQLTLGKLISALEGMPADAEVANLKAAHSYRGYYEDLAFERAEGTRPAAALLAECKAAMGRVFCGYKGGDYVMGALTPLWVASYGTTGDKLMAVRAGGELETAPNEW